MEVPVRSDLASTTRAVGGEAQHADAALAERHLAVRDVDPTAVGLGEHRCTVRPARASGSHPGRPGRRCERRRATRSPAGSRTPFGVRLAGAARTPSRSGRAAGPARWDTAAALAVPAAGPHRRRSLLQPPRSAFPRAARQRQKAEGSEQPSLATKAQQVATLHRSRPYRSDQCPSWAGRPARSPQRRNAAAAERVDVAVAPVAVPEVLGRPAGAEQRVGEQRIAPQVLQGGGADHEAARQVLARLADRRPPPTRP